MSMRGCQVFSGALLLSASLLLAGLDSAAQSSGHVLDEARQAGRDAASLPMASEDYFHDMDGGVALSPDEIKGRNMWVVWTGGNDRFWDGMTASTFGAFDLLKIVAYDPAKSVNRNRRWNYLGLMNEPCFDPPTQADPKRFGLMLDERRADCRPDPFENETKYPGIAIGARGKTVPVGSLYGYASGIVGLRLFPNPAFDAAAAARWDPAQIFQRSQLLQRSEAGAPLSRRHVLRVLPHRTQSRAPAGRCRPSAMGRSQRHRGRAIYVGRPALRL